MDPQSSLEGAAQAHVEPILPPLNSPPFNEKHGELFDQALASV